MRSASARTDERGVGLGNVHRFCDFANSFASQQRLNSLNVAFLSQPSRQIGRVPPSIRDRVFAQSFRNARVEFLALGLAVTEQRNLRHVVP